MKELTDQAYWQENRASAVGGLPSGRLKSFQPYIEQVIKPDAEKTVIEIGAHPGQHLAAFALRLRHRPAALDFIPEVHQLKERFDELGIPGLRVFQEDFLKWQPEEKFDVVMSYGFIEHFDDWRGVVDRHFALAKPGGHVIIGVPILGGGQMALRRVVYTQEKLADVLRSHNLDAMSLASLQSALNGAQGKIEFASYIWCMRSWITRKSAGVRSSAALPIFLWKIASLGPRLLNWSCHAFSPYALVIAQKKS